MVKYHKLFEVKFFHQYYEAFSSKDFEIQPSPKTQNYIHSFGLIFKQTAEGFVVLFKEEKQSLLEKLKEELAFEFGIKLKNKHFETFTNVLPSSETKKYVFSNKSLQASNLDNRTGEDNQIKIHPDGFVNENNVCLCCYNSIVLSELLVKNEVLIQQKGETLYEGKLEDWQNVGRILGNDFGMYEITPVDSELVQLFYLPDIFSRVFGIIELVVGGPTCSFSEIRGSEYQVCFESRQVQWNYYFVSEAGKLYDTVDLFAGKEKLTFTNPELVKLINGQQALKVMSEQFYSLKHRYNGQNLFAELKSSIQNAQSDLGDKKVNLVTPDVTRIKGKRDNGKEIYYSDMYIYL